MDFDKARAELPILRNFIDFVNRQIGVYCDCLAGFKGNKVRIERQIPRAQRPVGRKINEGRPVIVYASVEDPTSPDVIHHRIIRADDFIKANAESGFNEQQMCWSIVVFMLANLEDNIRPQIARARGVHPSDVVLDELGDLRILRNSIVHDAGTISAAEHDKLKVMSTLCRPGERIVLAHAQMNQLFIHVKQAIGKLILDYTGSLPGAPKASEIVGM
jgi:hypothetical protein